MRQRWRTILMGAVVAAVGVSALGAGEERWEGAWNSLGSKSWEATTGAERTLLEGGDAAAKFVTGKLVAVVEMKEITALVLQLDDEKFKVREAAQQKLLEVGKGREASLKELVEKTESSEVATRLQAIVDKLELMKRPATEEDQREVRGVRVIAACGANAETYLKQVEAGAAWGSTRREATVALDKLARAAVEEMIAAAVKAAQAGEDTTAREVKIKNRMKEAELAAEGTLAVQLKRLTLLEAEVRRRKGLEEKLAENPKDAKVRGALVTLMLVELDDPAGAAKVAAGGDVGDESLRRAVELAARPVEKLSTEEKEELAQYYIVAAKLSRMAGKVSALNQAGSLLAVCLSDLKLYGAKRQVVQEELEAVRANLEQLNVGIDGWMNAVSDIKLDHDVVAGEWVREKDGVAVSEGEFAVMNLAARVPENYELKVRLIRRTGEEGIFVGFPVGKARANLNIGGWTNTYTGLETIDGKGANAADESVMRDSGIENGMAYEYLISVKVKGEEASIVVKENNKVLAKWEGKQSALTCHTAWQGEKQKGVTVGAHECEVIFERVQVRKVGE